MLVLSNSCDQTPAKSVETGFWVMKMAEISEQLPFLPEKQLPSHGILIPKKRQTFKAPTHEAVSRDRHIAPSSPKLRMAV